MNFVVRLPSRIGNFSQARSPPLLVSPLRNVIFCGSLGLFQGRQTGLKAAENAGAAVDNFLQALADLLGKIAAEVGPEQGVKLGSQVGQEVLNLLLSDCIEGGPLYAPHFISSVYHEFECLPEKVISVIF
jgi:hypothetical protein